MLALPRAEQWVWWEGGCSPGFFFHMPFLQHKPHKSGACRGRRQEVYLLLQQLLFLISKGSRDRFR